MRKLAPLILVPSLLASCAPFLMAPNASSVDGLFLQAVTGSNLFEIQSSQLALTKTNRPEIRTYAQMMIDHHTAAQNQVNTLAAARNIPLPRVLPPELQLKVATLASLTALAFETAYLQEQVIAHQMSLSLMQNERMAGKDTAVVAFANQQTPIVQQHLQQAQTLLTPPTPSQP